jgi:hypothetical protein
MEARGEVWDYCRTKYTKNNKIKDTWIKWYHFYGRPFFSKYYFTDPNKWTINPETGEEIEPEKEVLPFLKNAKILVAIDVKYKGKVIKNYSSDFGSEIKLLKWSLSIPKIDRALYEITLEYWMQKLKLDIDLSFKNKQGSEVDDNGELFATPEERSEKGKKMFLTIIVNAVIDTFHEVYGFKYTFKQDDIYIYDSSTKDKHSFHLVIQGYHVKNAEQAKEFCKRVRNNIPYPKISKTLDLRVYTPLQQMRLINCCKSGKTNFKKPCTMTINNIEPPIEDMDDIDSLIGYIPPYSKLLKDLEITIDPKKENKNNSAKKGKEYDKDYSGISSDITKDEMKLIGDLMDKCYPGVFSGPFLENGGRLGFTRNGNKENYCKICNRTHDGDNCFCLLWKNGELHYYCYRDETSPRIPYLLGRVREPTPYSNNTLLEKKDFDLINPNSNAKELNAELIGDNKVNYITKDKYIGDLPAGHVIISAYLGTGKTKSMEEIVENCSSCLFLVTRVLHARSTASRFGIKSYLDFNKKSHHGMMMYCEKLVITPESIWKLIKSKIKYNIIFLDEIESILAQLHSPTMKEHLQESLDMIAELIRYANKYGRIIAADAFILDRTLQFFKDFNITYTLVKHTTPQEKRVAIEVKMKKEENNLKEKKKYSPRPLFLRAIESLRAGKKLYKIFSSKGQLLKFKVMVDKLLPHIKYRCYYGGGPDYKEDFKDVNESWFEYIDKRTGKKERIQLIMTSVRITVGINYDKYDVDELFLYIGPGPRIRDIFQCLMRVRHIKSNILYYSIQPTIIPPSNAETSIENIKLSIENTEKWWKHFGEKVNQNTAIRKTKWIENVYTFNVLENGLGRKKFHELFRNYLEFCHYEAPKVEEVEETNEALLVEIPTMKYNEIPVPPLTDIHFYQQKVKLYNADEIEKAIVAKYLFNLNFDEKLSDDAKKCIGELYDKCYVTGDKTVYTRLFNARYEKTTIEQIAENKTFKDLFGEEKESITRGKRMLFLDVVEKICNYFKMGNTMEECTIERSLIEKLPLDFFNPFLLKDLEIRKQGNQVLKEDIKSKVSYINLILKNWTGGSMKVGKKEKTIPLPNGKKKKITDYEFIPDKNLKELNKIMKNIIKVKN